MTCTVSTRKLLLGDVARILDVSASWVHRLERRGVLTAERTVGGMRLFDPAQVEAVRLARLAKPARSARYHTRTHRHAQ